MSFVVEVTARTLPGKASGTSEQPNLLLKAGVLFTDKQLTKKGSFVDSTKLQASLQAKADYLASDTWSKLFNFPPTFEMVARWLCEQLQLEVKQLEYVEIENQTLGVTTQYIP